ncbi:HAMP domain-containing sensor histidine kinase [Phascolarctobacterium faecium]|uniref:HAMP domain-containing sensor histidine kinase n=1 Tax=Phascolarctobacterium faecium TaxID=33025 RepID=UPI00307A07FC
MKKLSVKMKITLWYTGLIVIILSAIFTAVLLATDKVLLLGVQNKLEEEVYDFAEELKIDSNGRLRLEKLDFLKDGVRLAVYHENGQMITGLVASGLPETPFADELLQKAGSDQQNWFVYDFYFKPRHADNFYWVRGTVPLSSAYAERDKILRQCALFFPLLILLAALGGYWITKKAFRPVTRITEAAAQISSGSDLSKRIELEGADDEIDTLAKTFDGMFARLEDAFEAERQFTDDASHELRTPTSVIIAQAECGLQSPDLEGKQQALQGVLQQAGKMSKLVNQLLQLSRADRHKESLHLEEFDLSELTEMVAEEAQGLAESKAVTLTAEIEPGILVKADQTLLMRIWLNLLTNAVKYGRQQGQIWLTLKSDGKNAVGTVRDDGIGISAAELPKIWKRFYRVNTARSSGDDSGTGLGLAMVKWMVESHGGTVSAVSTLGAGSTFSFTIPLRPS